MTAPAALLRTASLGLALALTLALATPALAVVEAKLPLPKIYELSKSVVIGTVEKVNADTGDLDVVATETLSGDGFAGPCRIAIAIPEVRPRVAAGQPVLIMASKGNPKAAILHVGNTWALAEFDGSKRIPFFIARGLKPDFPHTFPGTTQTLIAVLRELKTTGKSPLIDKVDPKTFDGIKAIGKLPVDRPTAITAGDFDGDKSVELAVATAGGVQVYSLAGGAIGPSKAMPPAGFPGDAALPAEALAAAHVTEGDGQAPDRAAVAIVVRPKGITREATGDAAGKDVQAIPFAQLTGDESKTYFPASAGDGIKAALATGIDLNGDGLQDVFIATDEAAIVMINRGYGAYFVVPRAKDALATDGKYPFAIDRSTRLTSADLDGDKKQELIVVAADGTVFVAR